MFKLDPESTALVTMETQRGVVGDLATMPAVASAARSVELEQNIGRLADAARLSGIQVVHALAHFRPDHRASPTNAPLLRAARRIEGQLVVGSTAADLIPALAGHPEDLISARLSGVSPFTGTDLDALLRGCHTSTLLAAGVSLNVGLMGLCIEAVNLGYEVVLVTDASVAVPPSVGHVLLETCFSSLARLHTVDEVLSML